MTIEVTVAVASRTEAAWQCLDGVPDPEVPVLSVRDLGIVRDVAEQADGTLEVVLTPTYSGCPATEAIAEAVRTTLAAAGLGPLRITHRLAPAWTSDWISAEGRRKLRAYGIAPPSGCASVEPVARVVGIRPRQIVPCPRCDSVDTERLSAFGSTACKALYRCLACREPFEHFKPI